MDNERILAKYLIETPHSLEHAAQRYGTVEEVAAAVGTSPPMARRMSPVVIPVDGGFLASGARP